MLTEPLPYLTYCDAVARETARIVEIGRGTDVKAPVPSCPDWVLADVLDHVGTMQRWMAAMIERLVQEPLLPNMMEIERPADPAEYPDWVSTGFTRIDEVLRAADPMAPIWAWGADKRVRFWPRRMAMELVVHRVDAELAAGQVTAIDEELAADGLAEFLENLHLARFMRKLAEIKGTGQTIGLGLRDRASDWGVTLVDGGFDIVTDVDKQDAAISTDTAEALLLLIYGRIGLDDERVSVAGDKALAADWLAKLTF